MTSTLGGQNEGYGLLTMMVRIYSVFRDGEKIVVTTKLNEAIEHKCRYIDDEHVEVGSNLYHINEFEEKMHRNGAVYRPLREKAVERQEVQAGGKKNRVDSQKVR